MRVTINGNSVSVKDWRDAIRVVRGLEPRACATIEVAPGIKRRVK